MNPNQLGWWETFAPDGLVAIIINVELSRHPFTVELNGIPQQWEAQEREPRKV
ncbi:MAG TPA: hypothetical protein V6D33_06110 [Cyanophyceae cyanobacterium]